MAAVVQPVEASSGSKSLIEMRHEQDVQLKLSAGSGWSKTSPKMSELRTRTLAISMHNIDGSTVCPAARGGASTSPVQAHDRAITAIARGRVKLQRPRITTGNELSIWCKRLDTNGVEVWQINRNGSSRISQQSLNPKGKLFISACPDRDYPRESGERQASTHSSMS